MPTDAQNPRSASFGHSKTGMPTETWNARFYAVGSADGLEAVPASLSYVPWSGTDKNQKPRFSHCENPEFCHAKKTLLKGYYLINPFEI